MRVKIFFECVIFIFLFFDLNLSSQQFQFNPETFIKDVQANYSKIDNFVIDFNQIISSSAIEGRQQLKGKLYYSKTNRYRLEINGQLIVCDGQVIYNYSKNSKRVVITNFEENFFSPQKLLVDLPEYSKIEYKGEENLNNQKVYKFLFFPERSNPEFKQMMLWIGEDKIIYKIQTEDWAGNKYSFVIEKFLLNQPLKSELFKFKIPAGVKVVDLR